MTAAKVTGPAGKQGPRGDRVLAPTSVMSGPCEALAVRLPLRTRSELNARDHWAARHRRLGEHRRVVGMALVARVATFAHTPRRLIVTLTRVGPRTLDTDNLAGALKGVRDGVADALGIDDGDPRITWCYDQRKGTYGVQIDVRMVAEDR